MWRIVFYSSFIIHHVLMVRIALGIIWLLRFLPLTVLAPVGRVFGLLSYVVAAERRRVGRINLRLCFPTLSEAERSRLLRSHFQAFGRAILERGILWWSSRKR